MPYNMRTKQIVTDSEADLIFLIIPLFNVRLKFVPYFNALIQWLQMKAVGMFPEGLKCLLICVVFELLSSL